MSPRYRRVNEVCERLGISRRALVRLIDSGELEAVRINGKGTSILIPEPALESFLAARSTSTAAPNNPNAA